MSSPRFLAALLLAMTWFMAAWHVELEGIGLLPEHSHHTGPAHHPHDHAPHGHDHLPASHDHDHGHGLTENAFTVARGTLGSASLLFLLLPPAWLGLAALGCFCLIAALRRRSAPSAAPPPPRPRWAPAPSAWAFWRRCAPASLAPPALA